MGGVIAKVLDFLRADDISETKANPGGDYLVTANHYSAPGDDSTPLPNDYVALMRNQRTGGRTALGYADPDNARKTLAGGKRIYARNESGAQVGEVWLKNDGTLVVSNDSGSIELQPGGSINLNGVVIDQSGNITAPGTVEAPTIEADLSLKVASKELNLHVHGGVTSGSSSTSPF